MRESSAPFYLPVEPHGLSISIPRELLAMCRVKRGKENLGMNKPRPTSAPLRPIPCYLAAALFTLLAASAPAQTAPAATAPVGLRKLFDAALLDTFVAV